MYFCTLIMAQHFVTLHLKPFLVENCGLSTMKDTFSGVEPFPILPCRLRLFMCQNCSIYSCIKRKKKKLFFVRQVSLRDSKFLLSLSSFIQTSFRLVTDEKSNWWDFNLALHDKIFYQFTGFRRKLMNNRKDTFPLKKKILPWAAWSCRTFVQIQLSYLLDDTSFPPRGLRGNVNDDHVIWMNALERLGKHTLKLILFNKQWMCIFFNHKDTFVALLPTVTRF